jgi:hypothetical protein
MTGQTSDDGHNARSNIAVRRRLMGYETQWRDLRFRLRLFWAACLAYVPGVLIIALVLRASGGSDDQIVWIAGALLLGVMALGAYLGRYRCPRCGNLFIRPPVPWQPLKCWNFIELLARRCFYCGLVKGASGSGSVPRLGASHEHKS